jgi:hypothetical protein
MASSASYSGVPLNYPNQTLATNPNYMMGMGMNAGPAINIPGGQTPAGGLFYGASGDAQNLYAFGQQGSSAANGALGAAQGNAAGMQGIAGGLNGATSGDLSYANQALINAFDPQKQAYNYYLTQALSTAGAQEAQQGIGNTPYGAEVTGATGANFANNWQTQQIARENQGMQTATGLQNQYLGQQQAAAGILDQAGNLDIGAATQYLNEYGLQGSNMAAALQAMTALFGDMRTSTSSSGGGVSGLQNMAGQEQSLLTPGG